VTIAKGEPWGEPGRLAPGSPVASTDRELRRIIEAADGDGSALPEVGLLGGDMARTVGGRGDRTRLAGPQAIRLPLDLGRCILDGEPHLFVSHLVLRRSWWRGRVVAVMNAQWIGPWDVAPKSHPNDGLVDVFDGDPTLDDRLKARRRLPLGTHVPHRAIAQSRVPTLELVLDRPTPAWLDGERLGSVTSVSLSVQPGAYIGVV